MCCTHSPARCETRCDFQSDCEHTELQVEELSASAADKKQAKGTQDPLDKYCDDNPEADECRWV